MEAYDKIAEGIGFESWGVLVDYIQVKADTRFKMAVNWLCILHGLEKKL